MTDIEFLNEMFPYYEDMTDLEVLQTASRRVGAEKMAKRKDDRFYTILACVQYSLEKSGVSGVDEFINGMKKQWEE